MSVDDKDRCMQVGRQKIISPTYFYFLFFFRIGHFPIYLNHNLHSGLVQILL